MNEVENPCRMLAENHGHLNYPSLCVISSALEKKTVELVQTEELGGTANSSGPFSDRVLFLVFVFFCFLAVCSPEGKILGLFQNLFTSMPTSLGQQNRARIRCSPLYRGSEQELDSQPPAGCHAPIVSRSPDILFRMSVCLHA